MKKLLLSVLGLAAINSFAATSLIYDYKGTWESTVAYKNRPIQGTNKTDAPVVIYAGNQYMLNGTGNPAANVAPAGSSFWTQIGSLSGTITKYGTGAFTSIATNAEQTVSVTYAAACPTAVDSVLVSVANATAAAPLAVKVSASTTSGFSAIVSNLSGSNASGVGTVQYQVICH